MTFSLSAQGATLRYGATTALNTVSFTLDEPGIHGLLGRNGSGKTSLLSLIAGLRKPSAGDIRIDGEAVFENARAMGQVCIIREGGDIESSDSVSYALEFAAYMRPNWNDQLAVSLLDRFGVSLKTKVSALSRGQRAAVASTLGIASRAPLTLFDETYLGMDAPSRQLFYDALLEDFIDHPRIIVLSTHLIEEVAKVFERLIIIDQGRVLLNERAEALRGRGMTITGPAALIEPFTPELTILGTRELGSTRSVAVLDPSDDLRRRINSAGLEIGPMPLQDLFIHLTAKGDRK